MSQKNLAVLTGDRINEGFFFTRKCMAVLPGGQKKSGRNNQVTCYQVAVRRGSTVLL